MALTSTFIVVPFLLGAQGQLLPATPRRLMTRRNAIAAADSLAPFYAGVAVLLDRTDPVAGIFLEPLLICAVGDIPSDLIRQLAA